MVRSGERFCVTKPSCRTTSGKRVSACATRFWVCTCAMSKSVPSLKVTVMENVPSGVAVEFV